MPQPTIKKVFVDWVGPTSNMITWELGPIDREFLSSLAVDVERADAPTADFTQLNDADIDPFFHYLDTTAKTEHPRDIFYYRINLTWSGGSVYSDLAHYDNVSGPIAKDLIRRYNLILRTKIGAPCLVYKIKTRGERCLRCWDPVRQRVSASNCPECYNTGFTGGFHDPVSTYVALSPYQRGGRITDIGERVVDGCQGWIPNYPILSQRDVITSENKKFKVTSIAPTEFRGAIIKQQVMLQRIGLTEIENTLP